MERTSLDFTNHNDIEFSPRFCIDTNANMESNKESSWMETMTNSYEDETQVPMPVLPESLANLMDFRNSNLENRQSIGRFSIESIEMIDDCFSLKRMEMDDNIQNPFESTEDSEKTISMKKGCNCKKTRCLRMYCECFLNHTLCGPECNCEGCHNTADNIEEINSTMVKVGKKYSARTLPGCNCHKTSCQRNYCSCYKNGLGCSDLCQCVDCKNKKQ